MLAVVVPLALLPGTGEIASAMTTSEIAGNQAQACEVLGGEAASSENRTAGGGLESVRVTCKGGLLDGMDCLTVTTPPQVDRPPLVDCGFSRVVTVGGQQVPPGERIEIEPVEPLTEMVPTSDAAVPPLGGEGPKIIVSMVVYNQSGSTIHDNAMGQINACRLLGGDAQVGGERTIEGHSWIVVYCVGGGLDGLWCLNDALGTLCMILPMVRTPEEVHVAPTGGAEVPEEAAPAETVPPTIAPTMVPTVAPTELPAEPTVEPTMAPPPPPRNDNAVPPGGEAEDPTDPEPTPTEAPLL